MDLRNGKAQGLSVEVEVGARNSKRALIGAIEGATQSAGGVDLEMQFDVQLAERSRVISRDVRFLLCCAKRRCQHKKDQSSQRHTSSCERQRNDESVFK